jgi:hypothetical protein
MKFPNKSKQWGSGDLKLLTQLCEQGLKYADMEKFLGRSEGSIQKQAQIQGLSNGYVHRQYSHDKDYWSQLNPHVAYYSGLSSADCTLSKKGENAYIYSLSLCLKDSILLENLRNSIKYDGPVSGYVKIKDGKEYPQRRIDIHCNAQWFLDLEKYWNIVQNKTYRLGPPNITNEYLHLCWLIGLNDGDGCIYFDENRKKISFSFRSSSLKALEWVKHLTNKYFNFGRDWQPRNVRKMSEKWGNCYTYTVGGLSALKMYETLREFPVPKLDRKWHQPAIDSYLAEYKNTKKDKYDKAIVDLPIF